MDLFAAFFWVRTALTVVVAAVFVDGIESCFSVFFSAFFLAGEV